MTPATISARITAPSAAAAVVAAAFLAISYHAFRTSSSADFLAVWLAGQAFGAGRFDLIYPADTAYFTMLPPGEWVAWLAAQGYDGEVFPFIYPPIWAWAMSKFTALASYDQIAAAVSFINPVLFVAILLLARRVAAPSMAAWLYLSAGLVFLSLSSIGAIALFQNQPQIFVAFLTVLAIERAHGGAPRTAGLALALAAAIKLYPIFYALFWIASGERRAAAWAVGCGAALGCLSVAVAGWPLHAEFLREVRVIADTAMLTRLTYAWETVLAQLFYYGDFLTVDAPDLDPSQGPAGNWLVLPKPPVFAALLRAVQVAVLIFLVVRFLRSRDPAERAALWPFAFTCLSLSGPLAWSYHYLSAAAFLPMLLARLGLSTGTAVIAFVLFGTSPYVLGVFSPQGYETEASRIVQVLSTVTVTGMALTFFGVRRRSDRPAGLPGSAPA